MKELRRSWQSNEAIVDLKKNLESQKDHVLKTKELAIKQADEQLMHLNADMKIIDDYLNALAK